MQTSKFLKYIPLMCCINFLLFIPACNNSTNNTHQIETIDSNPSNMTNKQTKLISDSLEDSLPNSFLHYQDAYYQHIQKWEKFWQEEFQEDKDHAYYQNMQNQEAQKLDSQFIQLRANYKNNQEVLKELKNFQCLLPDCSAIVDNGVYLYPHKNITETYESIYMDKNTQVFRNLDIIQEYDYLLKNRQTTSIDLQAQNTFAKENILLPYRTLKFVWDGYEKLTITLMPKEEICQPYKYNSITTFIQEPRGTITKRYEEKLPMFSYPTDLVEFITISCKCKEMPQSANYNCNQLEEERKILWDKYIQDSRVIGILQQEQKLHQITTQDEAM